LLREKFKATLKSTSHGRIWVESEGEGKGSRFSFALPMELAYPEQAPPETADLPVIICTVSRRKDKIARVAKLGVHGFLVKPVEKKALLAKVAEILGHKRGDEEKQRGSENRPKEASYE